LSSARFIVLVAILGLAAATTVYAAAAGIREVASEATGVPALFLNLFTLGADQVPAFYALVGFLAPLLGIAFGFDAVNGERSEGTLPRLLAQPIHRDDVINGKFAAGLTVIGLMLVALALLVAGVGILRLGVVPTGSEIVRIMLWLAVSVVYVGFWLAFATLCSVVMRRAATSALVAIGVWLALTLFGALLVNLVAGTLAPTPTGGTDSEILRSEQFRETIARLSPTTLYQEATVVLLNPNVRSLGAILPQQADRAIASLLPLEQSLLLVWPQVVALVALTVVSFAAAYIVFMRQEVRA
ncbi:MAG: ABC transporter permease, partial [Chloroflexi bacterium]|nr:ABC transporter permease [Chloroflexota bacterium]